MVGDSKRSSEAAFWAYVRDYPMHRQFYLFGGDVANNMMCKLVNPYLGTCTSLLLFFPPCCIDDWIWFRYGLGVY